MKRMPERPDTWAWLAAWLEQNWPALYAGILGLTIAALRIMYGGGTLRRMAVEAPFAVPWHWPPVMAWRCSASPSQPHRSSVG